MRRLLVSPVSPHAATAALASKKGMTATSNLVTEFQRDALAVDALGVPELEARARATGLLGVVAREDAPIFTSADAGKIERAFISVTACAGGRRSCSGWGDHPLRGGVPKIRGGSALMAWGVPESRGGGRSKNRGGGSALMAGGA